MQRRKVSVLRLVFWFLASFSLVSFGQKDRSRFPFYSAKIHNGFIIAHNESVRELSRARPYGFQIDMGTLNTSPKAWKQTHCYSRIGLSFQHIQFGNPDELGSSTQLSAYLEPYLLSKKSVQLSFLFGFGASYLSKVFDEKTNPRNLFFSSPISFLIYLGSTVRVPLNPKWKLTGSVYYNHLSNGGIKMPNKGMNFPSLAFGVDYLPFSEIIPEPPKLEPGPQPWILWIESGFSLKNTPDDWAEFKATVPILSIASHIEKKVSDVHGFSLGLEFTEDQYLRQSFKRNNLELNHQILGTLLGHSFHFGKIRLSQYYGFYLWNEDPDRKTAYQRYSLFYQVTRQFYFGGTLKAHRHVADIFDFRLGWKIGI